MFGWIKKYNPISNLVEKKRESEKQRKSQAKAEDNKRRGKIIKDVTDSLNKKLSKFTKKTITVECYKGYMMRYPVNDVFLLKIELDRNEYIKSHSIKDGWKEPHQSIDEMIKDLKIHLNGFGSFNTYGTSKVILLQEFWTEDQEEYDLKMKGILSYPTTKSEERDDKLSDILN